jgi:hypothetical protein
MTILKISPLCRYEECRNPQKARGWCGTHYARWRKHGDPGIVTGAGRRPAPIIPPDERCDVLGCEKRSKVRGYCTKHYQRVMRTGSPEIVRQAGRKPNVDIPFLLCGKCDNIQYRAGLCQAHYRETQLCAEPGCMNKHQYGKARCTLHEQIDHCNVHLGFEGWCTGRPYANGMCKKCYEKEVRVHQPWLLK